MVMVMVVVVVKIVRGGSAVVGEFVPPPSCPHGGDSNDRESRLLHRSCQLLEMASICYVIFPQRNSQACQRGFLASFVIVLQQCGSLCDKKEVLSPTPTITTPPLHHSSSSTTTTTTNSPNAELGVAGIRPLHLLSKSRTPYTLRSGKMLRQIHKTLHELCPRTQTAPK